MVHLLPFPLGYMGLCPSVMGEGGVPLSLRRSTCLSLWPSWGGALFLCPAGVRGQSLLPERSVPLFLWEVCAHLLFFGAEDSARLSLQKKRPVYPPLVRESLHLLLGGCFSVPGFLSGGVTSVAILMVPQLPGMGSRSAAWATPRLGGSPGGGPFPLMFLD